MFVFVFACLSALAACDDWITPLEKSAKLSPEDLSQLSKDISMKSAVSQKPNGGVTTFLRQEAQARQDCPHCFGKDYSDLCPHGWIEMNDGSCSAPSMYKGLCNKTLSLALSSVDEKKEIEFECDVCWPCTGISDEAATCTRNWAMPCPNGYTPQDIPYDAFAEAEGITCTPDIIYEGQCESRVVFRDLQSKYDFAARCKTSWPCEKMCGSGFGPCPSDWEFVGDGLCVAPASYKMKDCPLLQNFNGWTNDMKRSFGLKCGVEWSCLADADASALVDACELDLSSCPRHWIERGNMCSPIADVKGPCAKPVDTRQMYAQQKLSWAAECGLEWPCAGENIEKYGVDQEAPRVEAHIESAAVGPIDSSGHIVIA